MSEAKYSTIDFDTDIHKAPRLIPAALARSALLRS